MPPDPKEVSLEWYRATTQVTRDLGLYAIKTLVALNSGAFVVLLTFLGNAAAQSAYIVPLPSIVQAMQCFLAGIVSASLIVAVAYLVSVSADPYKTDDAKWDWVPIAIYIFLSGISLASFVLGVLRVIDSVEVA